jgi:hypothetical protein
MAATIVYVECPTWFQKETSVTYSDYTKIYRFGFGANTKCSLIDGTKLRASDALEGSLNGWYECRLLRAEDKGRIMKYTKDNSALEAAVGIGIIITMCAFAFGKQ